MSPRQYSICCESGPVAAMVFGALEDLLPGPIAPTIDTIAAALRITRSRCKRALDRLCGLGVLSLAPSSGRHPNAYQINPPPVEGSAPPPPVNPPLVEGSTYPKQCTKAPNPPPVEGSSARTNVSTAGRLFFTDRESLRAPAGSTEPSKKFVSDDFLLGAPMPDLRLGGDQRCDPELVSGAELAAMLGEIRPDRETQALINSCPRDQVARAACRTLDYDRRLMEQGGSGLRLRSRFMLKCLRDLLSEGQIGPNRLDRRAAQRGLARSGPGEKPTPHPVPYRRDKACWEETFEENTARIMAQAAEVMTWGGFDAWPDAKGLLPTEAADALR